MVTLHIDTSNRDKVVVKLDIDGKVVNLEGLSKKLKAQQVLPLIDKALKKQGLIAQEIDRVEVKLGPGSFTGLRVGVAVANSIGWALNIQINDGRKGEIATLVYRT